MDTQPLSSLTQFRQTLKNNIEEIVLYFSSYKENLILDYALIVLSSFLVCLGLNFYNRILIYGALLSSPFVFTIIHFTIGVYKMDFQLTISSAKKLILGALLSISIGYLYFSFTPIIYDIDDIIKFSKADISDYLSVFILAFSFALFNKNRISVIIWILKFLMNWIVIFSVLGLFIYTKKWELFWRELIAYKLLFVFFFLGLYFCLYIFKLSTSNSSNKKYNWVYQISVVISFFFAIYFGGNQLKNQTTEHNVHRYLYRGLSSKAIHIENFTIDPSTKVVSVYYSGVKPISTQDEELKKYYKLSGYHFEFTEIK